MTWACSTLIRPAASAAAVAVRSVSTVRASSTSCLACRWGIRSRYRIHSAVLGASYSWQAPRLSASRISGSTSVPLIRASRACARGSRSSSSFTDNDHNRASAQPSNVASSSATALPIGWVYPTVAVSPIIRSILPNHPTRVTIPNLFFRPLFCTTSRTGEKPTAPDRRNPSSGGPDQLVIYALVPGRPGESHPEAPTDPCVNLSIYTALLTQPGGIGSSTPSARTASGRVL